MTGFDAKQFWENRLSRDYSLKGVGYESLGRGLNFWLYRVRQGLFRRVLRTLKISRQATVLDIGSGTGFYLKQLDQLGFRRVTGSDLTETAVGRLVANFPQFAIRQADISAEGALSDSRYNLITCFDVLFHIVDDQRFDQALANVSRLLEEDGLFLFSDNFAGETIRREHHVSRSREELEAALNRNGLQVVHVQPMFVLLNEPTGGGTGWLRQWWKFMVVFHRYLPFLGWLTGAVLYPIERLLLNGKGTGPSTHLVVCKHNRL